MNMRQQDFEYTEFEGVVRKEYFINLKKMTEICKKYKKSIANIYFRYRKGF